MMADLWWRLGMAKVWMRAEGSNRTRVGQGTPPLVGSLWAPGTPLGNGGSLSERVRLMFVAEVSLAVTLSAAKGLAVAVYLGTAHGEILRCAQNDKSPVCPIS